MTSRFRICVVFVVLLNMCTCVDKVERYKSLSFATIAHIIKAKQSVLLATKNTSSTENYKLTQESGEYSLEINEGTCNYLIVGDIEDEDKLKELRDKQNSLGEDLKKILDDAEDKSYTEKLKIIASFKKQGAKLEISRSPKVEKHKCPKLSFKEDAQFLVDENMQKLYHGLNIGDKYVEFSGKSDDEKSIEHGLIIRVIIDKDEKVVGLGCDMLVDFSPFKSFYTSKILIDCFEDIIGVGNGLVIIIVIVCVVAAIVIVGIVVVLKKKKKTKG